MESQQAASEAGGDPLLAVNKMNEITVGMRLEAKDSYEKWFCAKVVEKDEETEEVLVHFDGWSSRYDELLHIQAGRLRHLTPEQLEKKTKALKTKTLKVGDRVQAKWKDGRMYFGKVLQLLKDMAVVLFDDGVEYTTPITAVRKRRVDPSPSGGEISRMPVQVGGRKRKMVDRGSRREDSTSQPSASPPSSPLFAPKRIHARSTKFWETDESSCTESDAEEGHTEDRRKRQRSDSSPTYVSSDSDLRSPHKRGKRQAEGLREPYKLRRQPMSRQPYSPVIKNSPLKQKSAPKGSSSSSSGEGTTSSSCAGVKVEEEEMGEVGQREGERGEGGETIHRTPGAEEGRDTMATKVTNEKEILTTAAQGGDPSLELPLNDTPSTVLVSATHESNFTLFCDEKVTFLPRRKLDFVGQPLLNPSHHFGEEVGTRLQHIKCEEKGQSAFTGIDQSSEEISKTDQSEAPLPASTPPIALHVSSLASSLSPSLPTSLPPSLPLPSTSDSSPLLTSQPSSEPTKELARRDVSDLSVPKSPSRSQTFSVGSPSRRRSSSSQASSVNTRFRAQTAFQNSKKGKDRGKQGKVAPKELVIMWDHNEFKCQHAGCTKSFRKQSLLQSHMKHYHNIIPTSPYAKGKKGRPTAPVTKSQGEKTPTKSPHSPTLPVVPPSKSPKTSSPMVPVSSALATETAPSQHQTSPTAVKKSRLPHQSCIRGPTVEQKQTTDKSLPNEVNVYVGGTSSKSPKKGARQKSGPLKPPAPGSNAIETVAIGTPVITGTAHSQRKSASTLTPQHTPNIQSSKHKLPAKKQKLKESVGSSQKSESLKPQPLQLSPSTPSSSAANLPIQRTGVHLHKEIGSGRARCRDLVVGETEQESVQCLVKSVPGAPVSSVSSVRGVEDKNSVPSEAEGTEKMSRSASPSSEVNDDVVHCVCGDDTDEGFMIQCEQCLCWQHGDCIGISKHSLPEKYICYFCTNPPGLRQNQKYQYDLQWYCDGTLPSLPGGPKFPCPEAILKCHALLDKLYQLRKMSHSSKVKLQAARTPHHAYMRQWAKECACLDKEMLRKYLATALQPVAVGGSEKAEVEAEREGDRETAEGSSDMEAVTDTVEAVKQERGGVIIEGAHPISEGLKLTNGDSYKSSSTAFEGSDQGREGTFNSVKTSVVTQASAASSLVTQKPRFSPHQTSCSPTSVAGILRVKKEPLASGFDSVGSELDFTSEFGVQELSVFAVKKSQQATTDTITDTHCTTIHSTSLPPLPLPEPSTQKTVQSSNQSAFKPVIVSAKQTVCPSALSSNSPYRPKTPTCTSSQLTSLLTSPISTHSPSLATPAQQPLSSTNTLSNLGSVVSPALSPVHGSTPVSLASKSTESTVCSKQLPLASKSSATRDATLPCTTQLSRLNLVPNISGDSIYAETASSLPATQISPPPTPVLLKDFTEAFVHGDTTNWFQRMLLLDHIENVQDGILRCIEEMEREVDELSEKDEDSDLENPESLVDRVQSTLDQLTSFQQQVLGNAQ